MKEWFIKLPLLGKVYVVSGFSIFVTIPLSSQNVYQFSTLSLSCFTVLGLRIAFDIYRFRKQARLSPSEQRFSIKVALGYLVVPAYYIWALSLAFSIIMNHVSTTQYKALAELESYWYSGGYKQWFGGCHYYARVKNSDGSNTICVGHIKGHRELKSVISQQVSLVGRSSILGSLIDDIKPL